jgi:murein DD-endopeptidase MepM/ murein hydrolase activator NlpD
MTRSTNAGNWIAIDLGNNRYAFYAHLQPGSIRVKAGDTVHKGQVIALLGNSEKYIRTVSAFSYLR